VKSAPTAPPRRERLDNAVVNYRLRIVGFPLFAAMLASVSDDHLSRERWGLAAFFLAWPHIAYWLARRSNDVNRAEQRNLLADFFLGGPMAVAFSFQLWPTTTLFVMGLINSLLFGGTRWMFRALMMLGLGLVASAALFDIHLRPDSEPLTTLLSIIAIISYVVYIGSVAYRLRMRQRDTRAALEREERNSRALLANVFPEPVIPRLRAGESPIADQFADVTVVFADIVEFTPLSERLGPRRTVLLLNELFAKFDQAAARLGVEKIETTGDGYLAVGGAPEPLDNHPEAVADFALGLLEAARTTPVAASEHVQIRVGIHTGPVFGGVIGESRFHYKIFGATVNTASRIQAQSQPGRILVSENTYKRIRGMYALEEHGTIDLKGHGPMRTYWLDSRPSKA
jgi:class 3 adenylate cyclase